MEASLAIVRRRREARHAHSTSNGKISTATLQELAGAGYWGMLIDPKYGGQGAPFARFTQLPDAHGHLRRHDRRHGLGPRLHRRRRSGPHLRHARAKATLPAPPGQRRSPVRLRPDRAVRRLRPHRPAHHRHPRWRRLRSQRRKAVHHQRHSGPDGRRGGSCSKASRPCIVVDLPPQRERTFPDRPLRACTPCGRPTTTACASRTSACRRRTCSCRRKATA